MTGFGSAEGVVGGARVTVEIRSVNHRFFNPAIKLPAPLSRWELEVREALRRDVSRGHVTLTARHERLATADAAAIDESRFSSYVTRLRDLQERHGLEGPLDIGTVLRLPEVLSAERSEDEGSAPELMEIVHRAAAALNESRAAEGSRLATVLGERLDAIEAAVAQLADRAPARLEEQRQKLQERVAELAAGVQLDPQRLAQEVAIMADRLDIGEEIDRFRSHLSAFRETLAAGSPEGVGKRLGFLLQELLREANTTGSKSNDSEMIRLVVSVKEELERVREQVENLE